MEIYNHQLKQLIVISFLLLLSMQILSSVGVSLHFQANKDYIAQNLCENKDEPALACDGKCYLRKQMKKTAPQQEQQTIKIEKLVTYIALVYRYDYLPKLEQEATTNVTTITGLLRPIFDYPTAICSAWQNRSWRPPIYI